jgi:hypothetical protein
MTVIVKHNKTNTITDWTQAQLNEQIALGNFAPGTTLANIVLPSDWNNDHTLTGLGTMAEQDATAVAITGGTINNTTIGATTATTGKFTSVTTPSVTATTTDLTLSAISTGVVKLNTVGGEALRAVDNGTTSGAAYWVVKGASGGFPTFGVDGTNPNIYTTIYAKGTVGEVRFATNTTTVQQVVSHTASAVNYVQVSGNSTGNAPSITTQGSDAASALVISSKGAGNISFWSFGSANRQFVINGANASVNYHQVAGSVAGQAPIYSVNGNDTNISMAFQPKGTGAIDLAAGSSGVNISNGGTVTAITRTASGGSYTSIPSIAISAPTTAGGVQATASAALFIQAVTIQNGGTGYTVGNTLTVVGGTSGGAATLIVSTVSSGVITGVTVATGGTSYTVLPTNPFSVTGGSGSGATFNATAWGVSATPTITNAGSGYIEQPTVTFSGGGGSGAAAYAQIGTATVFRSLANMGVFTGGGQQFGVLDSVATSTAYWNAIGGAGTADLRTNSGSTGGAFISNGAASNINFRTNINTSSATQTVIAHTASAVNYVQVTGAATGGSPTISTQGSDGNAGLVVQSKGTSPLFLVTTGSTDIRIQPNNLRSLSIQSVGSAVNYGVWTNSAAGFAPALSVAGTDTDIDLALTPKGAGKVRFGTRTASADVAITGYIEIKDAGGTVRRLAVVG